MQTIVWGSLGLLCGVLVACSGSDDDPNSSAGSLAGGADGGANSGSLGASGGNGSGTGTSGGGAGTSSGGPGTGTDGGSDTPPPRPTGPGSPPSRSCAINADGDGFFTLTTQASGLPYVVRLPAGYDAATPYPAVIGAHGCGDNAQNFATWAMAPWQRRDTQDYVAVSLGGRDGGCWDGPADEAKVLEVLDDVRSCFYVHQKKVTLAGYSSGGYLAYYAGLRNAYLFAGLLIEHSNTNLGDQAAAVLGAVQWKLDISITANTGDQDIPLALTQQDRDMFVNAGFPVQYRALDGGTHDGDGADWQEWLLPQMAGFEAP